MCIPLSKIFVENAHWPRMNEVQAIRQVAIDFQPVESEIV